MVFNDPVSCKANGERNQLGAWLDSDLIIIDEKYIQKTAVRNEDWRDCEGSSEPSLLTAAISNKLSCATL